MSESIIYRQEDAALDVRNISADTTLTFSDSGKVLILDNSTGELVTLPSLSAGLHFKFIVGLGFETDNWIIDSAEGDNITGNIVVNGATVTAAAVDQINFVASQETVGDFIELIADYDNSQWIVWGIGNNGGSITATDPD